MTELFGSIWWLIVSLGILVTIHEFGHYWVARRCGVRVLRFSVGFGRALWSRRGRDGTEYVVAAIPLGGYVKMLDEREQAVPASQASESFNRQSVGRRMAIVAAGPLANLILCVGLLWATFVIGRPDYAPVVGQAAGLAAEAGLRRGDSVLSVDGRPTPTWTEVQMALLPVALDREDVAVRVRDADGAEATRTLRLSRLPDTIDERRIGAAIGLAPRHALGEAVVGAVGDGPVRNVLRPGDRIVSVDGRPVAAFADIAPLLQEAGAARRPVVLTYARDGARRSVEVVPQRLDAEGAPPWGLGIAAARVLPAKDAVLRYGPLDAVPAAFGEAVHQTREIFAMIGRAFTGRVAVENTVAGPITIARAANAFAGEGIAWFLTMLAMLSLSLGILNLLPVPILDGGHLLYYLIELVKGSPVSERVMAAGQYVGLALIVGLMGLAFYNDIVNNLVR